MKPQITPFRTMQSQISAIPKPEQGGLLKRLSAWCSGLLLPLLLLASLPAAAGVSHVQVAVQTLNNSATIQARNANDAVVVALICQSSNTPSSVSLSASGWTFTQLGSIGGNSAIGWAAMFGAIAPNTNSTTLTSSWSVSGGCGFHSMVGDEFSGNDTTGGTTTFDAGGTLFASNSSGSCSFTSVKPGHDSDALWGVCAPQNSTTAVGSGFTKGADDGSGDWSEWKILATGTSGVAQAINFTSTGGWVAMGMTIKPSSSTPAITSLSSTSGPVGASVTINGSNLGSSSSGNTVTFNGTVATTTSWSPTKIVAAVPSGATTGPVVVTVGGTASNSVNFTVTPNISSLSPTSGPTGTSVTISGTTFGASQGSSTVTFNGAPAAISSWSATQIVAVVPSTATTGNIVVTVAGNASNGVTFTVTSPNISSLSPASGPVGASVTMIGTNFGASQGSSTVTFNATAATTKSWSATQIVAVVPSGATTGPVVVTVGGNASNSVNFTVTPNISSLSPTSGPTGISVTISGTNFGASQGSSTVTFNGTTAAISSWSATQIVAAVPSGAITGPVVVTVGGNASNGVNFTVMPAITSLSPTSGPAGTSVAITGTSLGGASGNTVTFNGTAATPTSWNATQIVAPVPSGATTGPVVVNVGGNASNGVNFTVSAPPPLRTGTFFVNRTDDPQVPSVAGSNPPVPDLSKFCQNTSATDTSTPCSLREAVVEANGDVNNSKTSPDTIMLQAGTFHLNIASTGFTPLNATTGHLDITNAVTIVGAGNNGASVTTIQADSTLNDQVFVIDASEEGSVGFPVAIRNLVIQGGKANPGDGTGTAGGVFSSGGAFEWEAGTDGTGQLQLTSVTITGNTATDATNPNADDGGGVALFNTASVSTPAPVNITGSTISSNTALDAGGGVALKGAVSLTVSNSTVTGNHAVGGGVQQGGGLFFCVCGNAPTGATSSPSQIQNSTISTNTAGASGNGEGGGVWTDQSLTINQGSFIQGNTGSGAGGGIATVLGGASDQVIIMSSTITGNITSGNGGGIEVDAGSNANLQLQFNRIVGNTAGSDTGLANEGTGTVSATDNWWGCDQGPSTTPCDTAGGTGPINFKPWLNLTNTASPGTVLNGASPTLTASFLQDSLGGAVSSSNLGALIGQAVSWIDPVNGTLSNQQTTIQSNGTATSTLTASAPVTPGTTTLTASAQVVVDNVSCQGFSGNCPTQASVNVQDFNIGPIPPQTVNVGSSGTVSYLVTVSAISGFNGTVTLSCPNPPAGISCTFNPPTIQGSGTSKLTVSIPSGAGTYNFLISGSTTGLPPHNVSASLTVADFALAMSPPSLTRTPGQPAVFTVNCSSNTGFNGPVQLATSFPGGIFSNNPLNCPGSSALTVSQSTGGTFNVPVSGTFGNASPRSAGATLNILGSVTIAISGEGVCTGPPEGPFSCDVGQVTMTIGSDSETLSYGGLTTAGTIAQNFAIQFNKDSTQVTAVASQASDALHWQITFTAQVPGSIPFSTSQISFVPGQFPAAYTFSPASGSLDGGT